jgi:hypothetical protein
MIFDQGVEMKNDRLCGSKASKVPVVKLSLDTSPFVFEFQRKTPNLELMLGPLSPVVDKFPEVWFYGIFHNLTYPIPYMTRNTPSKTRTSSFFILIRP